MLWSIGKDSTVLLWLARKAFFGHVPFPLVHIDTSYKIPEMIQYRDRLAAEWGAARDLRPERGSARGEAHLPRRQPWIGITCCGLLKTEALQAHAVRRRAALSLRPRERASTSSTPNKRAVHRRDRRRARRRGGQPLEGALLLAALRARTTGTSATSRPSSGTSTRPSSRPARTCASTRCSIGRSSTSGSTSSARRSRRSSLYYDQGEGKRYRSLGCWPCTKPVTSDAQERRRRSSSS